MNYNIDTSENASTVSSSDSGSSSEEWEETDADDLLESSTDMQPLTPARESVFVLSVLVHILQG